MAQKSISIPQLDLFVSQSPAYQEAVDRYEAIRPILKEEQTLSQHRHPETGLSYGRLRRYLQRFRGYGLQGLVDQRKLPHRRGRPPVEAVLPEPIQQHIVRLAIAHPFTCRELARIIQEGYGHRVDHRGIQQVLEHRVARTFARKCTVGAQDPMKTVCSRFFYENSYRFINSFH